MGRLSVVLDSSILCSDLHFEGHSFRIFFDGLKQTDLQLFVPEIVIDEVVNHFRKKIVKNAGKIKASERNIAKLLKRPIFPIINDKQINEECSRYREILIRKLQGINSKILPYPNVSHKEIVSRKFSNRKPFKNSGIGYRDFLIWSCILDLAHQSGSEIIFISANTQDFGNGTILHPDLIEDLELRGIDSSLTSIMISIDKFNSKYIIPNLESLDSLKIQIQEGRVPELQLHEWVKSEIIVILSDEDLMYGAFGVDSDGFKFQIESNLEFSSPLIKSVRSLSSGNIVLKAETKAKGDFSLSSDWEVYRVNNDIREFWDRHANEVHSPFMRKKTSFIIEFSLVIEPKIYNIVSAEIEGIKGKYWASSRVFIPDD